MKLFVCSSVGTSDDDEEDEVSEEETPDDSNEGEDETDTDESNEEDHASDNTDNEKGAEKNAGKQINKNQGGHSEASSSSKAEISFKDVNVKQKINRIREEKEEKRPEFIVSKSPSKTKSMASGISLSARLKNVSTEIMVLAAIRSLNERDGSSVIAIKKYVMNNHPELDGPRTLKLIKNYIKKALVSGKLVQSKGKGLGGSFKVPAGTNRLGEQKERQNRKKLVKKPISDQAADKIKKKSKEVNKKIGKGEIKSATTTKSARSESAAKMPKISAALKASDPQLARKAVKVKDAKEVSLASDILAKQTKVAKQNKTENADSTTKKTGKTNTVIATKSATTITKMEKGKTAAVSKKKTTAKGRSTAMENIEIGSGDAVAVKPNKKTTAKAVKGIKGK